MDNWLSASGFSSTSFPGVQLDWEGAPVVDPSYLTASDCLDFMEIVYGSLGEQAVRRMASNPPLSEDLRAALAPDDIVYGWISDGGDTRSINLIVFTPDGGKYGVSVLTSSLCCPGKATWASPPSGTPFSSISQ